MFCRNFLETNGFVTLLVSACDLSGLLYVEIRSGFAFGIDGYYYYAFIGKYSVFKVNYSASYFYFGIIDCETIVFWANIYVEFLILDVMLTNNKITYKLFKCFKFVFGV